MALRTTPLSPTFGAEVHDVNLREPISPERGAELRALFFRHHFLLFRGQDFGPSEQIDFMSLISRVVVEPEMTMVDAAAVAKHDRFSFVSNTEKATLFPDNNEYSFHADFQFSPMGSLQGISLYAEVMEHSAPTTFANMVAAVSALSAELRARVEGLLVDNMVSYDSGFRADGRSRMSNRRVDAPAWMYPHAVHPVIERHPVTNEEYLDVSEMFSSHILGWDDASSDKLFSELAEVSYSPGNLYQHEWQKDDFLAWDNIALQHKRGSFPGKGVRTLRRVLANPYELGALFAASEAPDWVPPRKYGVEAEWPGRQELLPIGV